MVLFERAMIELSSLTASVTLQRSVTNSKFHFQMYSHQRVWLLLLLENGGRGLIILWRVSGAVAYSALQSIYLLGLSAIRISVKM